MVQKAFGVASLGYITLAILAAVLAGLPWLVSIGYLSVAIEILILAVAACGLNLIFGYADMVSFGPAGHYAVGAYTTALLITKGNVSFALAMVAGPVAAAISGLIIGWFCVRRTAIYFALLTLAFSQIIYTIIFQWYSFTGGDNGIVGVHVPHFLEDITPYYYFTLIIATLCLAAMWLICNSAFGRTLQAIRENPERTSFIGINVKRYRLAAYVLSSFFIGAAGSLFCGFNHNVFPDYAHWAKGADFLVVCLLGGIYNFFGPVLGAAVYIFIDKIISSFTEFWPLFLGTIIILVVLFLRGGFMGFLTAKLHLLLPHSKKGGAS